MANLLASRKTLASDEAPFASPDLIGTDSVANSIGGGNIIFSAAPVNGTDGNDWLNGTSDSEQINGLNGHDVLKGFGGADRLDGGAGMDAAFYADSAEGVGVNLATGHGFGGSAEGDRLFNIESIYGSLFNDSLIGNNGINNLYGLDGADYVDGGDGFDYLDGGNGNDVLKGGGGDDALDGGHGDDTLKGGGGADTLVGGAGNDTVDYSQSPQSAFYLFVDLGYGSAGAGDAQGDKLIGIENVTGSAYANHLRGDGGANVLKGLDGGDVLVGLAGDDVLYGGNGDDELWGGETTLQGSLPGADRLIGEGGNDRYFVDNSAAVVIEGIGQGEFDVVKTRVTYALAAGSEVEILETSSPASTTALDLVGNEFGNTITGNNGQNTLVGGMGRDVMTGGDGQDTFVWRTTAETGVAGHEADVVTDFNPGVLEFLVVNPIDADETVAGNQDFTFRFTEDFTAPGQIRYFTTDRDTYILLNTDADMFQEATIRLPDVYSVQPGWFLL
jgi:Ca2+-binding RTX toxin-like protein